VNASEQTASDERRRAAEAALAEVESGMKVGLGTGRAAEHFVRFLGERVRAGLDVLAVATSERTEKLAHAEGIRLTTLESHPHLDLVVDGADEIGPRLTLIKGAGGALFREKIVASAASRMVVIGEARKVVARLGACPLPIEIEPFGARVTRAAIERTAGKLGLSGPVALRMADGGPFVTDGGNHIVDASFGLIADPDTLADELKCLTGVVEHGLFVGIAKAAIVARGDRVERLSA
jgi:ribose 5-phosphate isomerase A